MSGWRKDTSSGDGDDARVIHEPLPRLLGGGGGGSPEARVGARTVAAVGGPAEFSHEFGGRIGRGSASREDTWRGWLPVPSLPGGAEEGP